MYSGGLIEPLPSGLMPWPPKSNLSTILEIRLNLGLDTKNHGFILKNKLEQFEDLKSNIEYSQLAVIH